MPLLFAAICLPLAFKWVEPNLFYGVRTAATQASEAEWYRLNQLAGIAGIVGGLAGFAVNRRIARSDLTMQRKQFACLAVLVGVAGLIVAAGST